MANNTVTLAAIYENQGLKEEALNIYKEILDKDPKNKEAKKAVNRLMGIKSDFGAVNTQMLDFFIKMDSEAEFLEFERWLLF